MSMRRDSFLHGLSPSQLKLVFIGFFLVLAVPFAILAYQAFDQLKWQAFHQSREDAKQIHSQINQRLALLIEAEEKRSVTDYNFTQVGGKVVGDSQLSKLPSSSGIAGLIGHFQINPQGQFSSPYLPEANSASNRIVDRDSRLALNQKIVAILKDNKLVSKVGAKKADQLNVFSDDSEETKAFSERRSLRKQEKPAAAVPAAQRSRDISADEVSEALAESSDFSPDAFEALQKPSYTQKLQEAGSKKLGQLKDLELESRFQKKAILQEQRSELPQFEKSVTPKPVARAKKKRSPRKETNYLPAEEAVVLNRQDANIIPIKLFESEVLPFEFSQLLSGEFIMYRYVFKNNQRFVQGALFDSQELLNRIVNETYGLSTIVSFSDIAIAFKQNLIYARQGRSSRLSYDSTAELRGALLYQNRFEAPFSDLNLVFSVRNLPSVGDTVVLMTIMVISIVLLLGTRFLYLLVSRQMDIARQQQNFVSSVSHELKTPLTSIRMYADMLREGWANEEKKREYYDFIAEESDRLSRLIGNVLQLAQVKDSNLKPELEAITVSELQHGIESKLSSKISSSGFTLTIALDCEPSTKLVINADHFYQVAINLVDNGIKFSEKSQEKKIIIGFALQDERTVAIRFRDFGPGIEKAHLDQIFKRFYRTENEMTRETQGAGIGLALVQQLVHAMNGTVSVSNANPGAEFTVLLPRG